MAVWRTAEAEARFGRGAVRHAIASGRWQRPVRGVVLNHNGPLSPDDRTRIALMQSAPGSALGGLTALALDGLTGFETSQTFVVLPEGADRPRSPGLAPHWSTELGWSDVHPDRDPRRTRPARSAVDAAAWSSSDRHARAIVIAAVQQGLILPASIFEALSRRGRMHRRALVIESALDADGGIHSLPERDFDVLRCRIGLPPPSRQRRAPTRAGRYYLDVAWEELGVAVEVHGMPHQRDVAWSGDLLRANEITIAGPRLLVFTSYAIRREQPLVEDQLQRMFHAVGWRRSGPHSRRS